MGLWTGGKKKENKKKQLTDRPHWKMGENGEMTQSVSAKLYILPTGPSVYLKLCVLKGFKHLSKKYKIFYDNIFIHLSFETFFLGN